MQFIKRLTGKLITSIVIAALVAVFATCAVTFNFGIAKADDIKDTVEYEPTELGIGNADFTDTSGSYPASPSNWTGAYVGGGNAHIVSGVIDLSTATYNNDGDDKKGNEKYELDQYPEYSGNEIPRTIFGTSEFAGSDTKTLLINTSENAKTAYAYTSSEMTFAPNSFFHVSVWAKTGDFTSSGATIKLNGLGENCAFINVNTVADLKDADGNIVLNSDKNNRYGWKQYAFYVRTGSSVTRNVTLSLGIGDALTGSDEDSEIIPSFASGYAFFDTVTAERISAEDFGYITSNFVESDRDNVFYSRDGRSMVIDLSNTDYLTDGDDEIGSFSKGFTGWTQNVRYSDSDEEEEIEHGGAANAFIFNNSETIDIGKDDNGNSNNPYGMTKSPWSPFGKAEEAFEGDGYNPFVGTNHNILALSTRSGNKFETACIGVASPDVVIERYKYYRFGVWVKGDSISGGNGISIGVKGQSNISGNNNKLHQWYTNLDGDSSDTAHYGWKEQVVYIQGSMLNDRTVHFELWLGSPNQKSSGIAYFDNATFTELSYSEYREMSGADGSSSITLDSISADTGITNGNFMSAGDFETVEYPLPAAEWTLVNAATSETTGFSANAVNTDNVIGGILPVDDETYDSIRGDAKLAGLRNPGMFGDGPLYNALVLSSSTKTAAGYKSSAFSLSAGSGYKVNVEMAVDGVIDGYGASLVLKSDNDVISTIEGIQNTGLAFRTYTFYINAPVTDQTLTVEIWLGLGDRQSNTLKLSEGNIYVKSVGLETWTVGDDTTVAQEYEKISKEYFEKISVPAELAALDYGVYSFNKPNLDYYDAYTYNLVGGFATPYQWNVDSANANVISGLFDSANMKGNTIYSGFETKDQTGTMLYVYNTLPNRTTYSYGNYISLDANTYYRLDVTLKVKLSDEELNDKTKIGANVKLTGSKEATFENIKDTSKVIMQPNKNDNGYTDHEAFRTFTFYISSGTNGGSVGLEISLGGDSIFNYVQGQLVVSDISLTSISNLTYEDAAKLIDEAEEGDEILTYTKAVKLSESDENNDGDDNDNNDNNETNPGGDIAWWIIPTVVFSACLLIAILLVFAFYLKDKVKRKKKKTYTTDYDRSKVIKQLDELAEAEANANKAEAESESETEARDELDDYDDETESTEEAATETTENAEAPERAEQSVDTEEKSEAAETTEAPENPQEKESVDTDLDD